MRLEHTLWLPLLATLALLIGGDLVGPGPAALAQARNPINHVIVIYQENHSFDNLYGLFPGADGIARAGAAATQVDKNGTPYATLPQPIDTNQKPPAPDPRFPTNLPNRPFNIDQYVPADQKTGDLVHRYYQEQSQINGGRMNKFAAWSDAAGLVMGYYDGQQLPLWRYAQQYVLADRFFHAAFGGSFLNHFWLVCACTPTFPNAPADLTAQLDANGRMVKDGAVTPDGFAINTSYPTYAPHPSSAAADHLVPPQTLPTIGDRLNEKNVSWVWWAGGWNDALAGKPDPLFQFHHQPFAYFQPFADGTPQKAAHLKDETDFVAGIKAGNLPAVSFVKPLGPDNEHPGYADLIRGDKHIADLIQRVQSSPLWQDTAIIVTYDENGGYWDHVAPPQGDRWGPGSRVPTLIISPYAKQGYVDHTSYDTTSILKFVENRFGLAALGARDAQAADLTNAFDFSRPNAGPRAGGLPWTPFALWAVTAGAGLLALGLGSRRLRPRP